MKNNWNARNMYVNLHLGPYVKQSLRSIKVNETQIYFMSRGSSGAQAV
jgi:hypothetical protein